MMASQVPIMPEVEVGEKRSSSYDEYGEIDSYKKPRSDNLKMRLLMVGRFCGALIGKGGENIKRMREQHRVKINGLNTRTNDRVLSIEGDRENCINAIKEILPVCTEGPYPANSQGKCTLELNLLVNSDLVGSVIGKGGSKIKEICDESSGKIKVYPDCLPNSNERVIAIGGETSTQVMAALEIVLNTVGNYSRKTQTVYYEPGNTGNTIGMGMGAPRNPAGMGITNQVAMGAGLLGQGGLAAAPIMPINQMMNNNDVVSILINNRDNAQRSGNNDSERLDFTQIQTVTTLTVPNDMCGAIIGKSGQNIRVTRQLSGARVDFTELERGTKGDRVITITGTQEQVQIAEQLMAQSVRSR